MKVIGYVTCFGGEWSFTPDLTLPESSDGHPVLVAAVHDVLAEKARADSIQKQLNIAVRTIERLVKTSQDSKGPPHSSLMMTGAKPVPTKEVMSGRIDAQNLADALYAIGWKDGHKERDHDPRGTEQWQAVVDALAAPGAETAAPTDTAILEWLIQHSATYTSPKAPLQLIVQEGHPVHKTHGVVGYRKGLREAIAAAMAADAPAAPATQSCDFGVGCEQAGVCYAAAHGEPARCGAAPAAQPEVQKREPSGYAYEYPGAFGGIHFTNGEERNGCRPTRSVPYWFEAQPEAAADRDDDWSANVKYLLDSYPGSIRVCEGGGPENLLDSLCVTFIKLRDAAIRPEAAAVPAGWREKLESARDALRWPAFGYVNAPYRIEAINDAYKLIGEVLAATPTAPARGSPCEVLDSDPESPTCCQWLSARFIALDLVAGKPIVQIDKRRPWFATWGTVRGIERHTAAPTAPPVEGPLASEYLGRSAGKDVWWPPRSVPPMLTPEQIKEACDGIYLSDFDLHAPEAYDEAIARGIEAAVREQLGVRS